MDSTKVENEIKQCRQCGGRNENVRVIECKNCCESNKYCVSCLTKWYPNVSVEEVVEACPVCLDSNWHRLSSQDTPQKAVAIVSGVVNVSGQVDLQSVTNAGTLKGNINTVENTNGWLFDTESDDGSPDQEPSTVEDSGTLTTTDGFWRGHNVGPAAVKLLQSVEHHYPNTFLGVHFRFQEWGPPILKQFHEAIKGFMETSVDTLDHDRVTSIQDDFKELEKFGFDLSWAHQRLNMVEKLKFENEPMCKELEALEDSIQLQKETIVERQNALMEAHEMLMEAQLEYNGMTHERNKKAREMADKFGDEYDQILKGHLGFGMLPETN